MHHEVHHAVDHGSANYDECGVSAYEARRVGGNEYEIKPTITLALSSGMLIDRPAFLLEGELMGKGSDGEPCLKVLKARTLRGAKIQTVFGNIIAI